jgi:hypothetical protein
MEENLSKQNNEYYYNKDSYSFKEIIDFLNTHNLLSYIYEQGEHGYLYSPYYVVNKYDPDVLESALKYQNINNTLLERIIRTSEQVRNVYSIINIIDNEIVSDLYGLIEIQYDRDNLLLKDIIKVVEMNE